MILINRSKFCFSTSFLIGLVFFLALVLVGTVPFGHALEIHHIFSTIDHDGHQHSDFDLCQWVQQHTSNSLAWDLPQVGQRSWLYSRFNITNNEIPPTFSSRLLRSRGPPNFLFF